MPQCPPAPIYACVTHLTWRELPARPRAQTITSHRERLQPGIPDAEHGGRYHEAVSVPLLIREGMPAASGWSPYLDRLCFIVTMVTPAPPHPQVRGQQVFPKGDFPEALGTRQLPGLGCRHYGHSCARHLEVTGPPLGLLLPPGLPGQALFRDPMTNEKMAATTRR